MSLTIRPEAQEDISEAFDWYEDRTPGLGSEFLRSVRACLAQIERTPELFPESFEDTRRASVRRFPYGVFFTADKHVSIIHAVYHVRRDPRGWHERTGA